MYGGFQGKIQTVWIEINKKWKMHMSMHNGQRGNSSLLTTMRPCRKSVSDRFNLHASQQLVNNINIVRWYECCSLSTLDADFLFTLTWISNLISMTCWATVSYPSENYLFLSITDTRVLKEDSFKVIMFNQEPANIKTINTWTHTRV